MSHQNTVWPARRAVPSIATTACPSDATPPPAWLALGLLALSGSVLFALACAAAWLSYHAQVGYVLAHNGNLRTEAKIWALLLDTGTAGVSLLRLYETLQRPANTATRVSLLGCITASVVMNLLHTPSHSPGGYLVAAVPPVMYAVFLEHLVVNLRGVLVPDVARRSMWHRATLWISFPALMWNKQRGSLRHEADAGVPATEDVSQRKDSKIEGQEEPARGAVAPRANASTQAFRRGRGPGAKRLAFEAALEDQVRCGDLRLFSHDERVRNAAAYQAAASLPAPLSRGAARRYVVQALSHMGKSSADCGLPVPAGTPKSP